jgi:hypothetical protein
MDGNTGDQWITRQELAQRYGLPVKTPAEWHPRGRALAMRGSVDTSDTA